MKNKKNIAVSVLIILFAVFTIIFIQKGNDHKECETVASVKIDKMGNKMIEKKHICKEKYSF